MTDTPTEADLKAGLELEEKIFMAEDIEDHADILIQALANARREGMEAGAEAEREACAELAETTFDYGGDIKHQPEIALVNEHCDNLAQAIRQRGSKA